MEKPISPNDLEPYYYNHNMARGMSQGYEEYMTGPLAVFPPNYHDPRRRVKKEEEYELEVHRRRNDYDYDSERESYITNSGMIMPRSIPLTGAAKNINEIGEEVGSLTMGDPGYIAPLHSNPVHLTPGMGVRSPNDLVHRFTVPDMFLGFGGIYISQTVEAIEAITGCETENKYLVFERNPHGRKMGKPILKCKEYSHCCARTCLPGDCRPFKMRVFNLWNHDNMCLELVRPCQCTFLCCNRPHMQVYYTEDGGREYLGKVVDNWDCCHYSFDVKDSAHKTIYTLAANCCQCGIWCKCPCRSCEHVDFDMYQGGKRGKPLGTKMFKRGKKNCCKNAITDADEFSVPFPNGSNWQHRALLLAAALLIDFRMFESGPENPPIGAGA